MIRGSGAYGLTWREARPLAVLAAVLAVAPLAAAAPGCSPTMEQIEADTAHARECEALYAKIETSPEPVTAADLAVVEAKCEADGGAP